MTTALQSFQAVRPCLNGTRRLGTPWVFGQRATSQNTATRWLETGRSCESANSCTTESAHPTLSGFTGPCYLSPPGELPGWKSVLVRAFQESQSQSPMTVDRTEKVTSLERCEHQAPAGTPQRSHLRGRLDGCPLEFSSNSAFSSPLCAKLPNPTKFVNLRRRPENEDSGCVAASQDVGESLLGSEQKEDARRAIVKLHHQVVHPL